MLQIRPYCGYGRAVVIESPVDEAQRDSGLVVPISFAGDDGVKRAVVLSVCLAAEYARALAGDDPIREGTVVYYRGEETRIGDVILVALGNVVAYEASE